MCYPSRSPKSQCPLVVDFAIFTHETKILGLDFLSFLEFNVTDAIDILLVAALLYSVYKLVRGTVAVNIFVGIVMVWALWKLTELLQMTLISNIVGGFISIGLIDYTYPLLTTSKGFRFMPMQDVRGQTSNNKVLPLC